MLFDEITNDGRLWSVRYEGEEESLVQIVCPVE